MDFQGGLIFYLVRLNRIFLLLSLLSLPIGTEALLLEGEPQEGHWLEVLPRGTESNRDGIGTKVIAYTTDSTGAVVSRVRQASCGEGMLQQNSRWLHF